jgi:Cro/C1-type helix-turn-helix DNA-binding protein
MRVTKLRMLLLGNLDEKGNRILDYEVAGACHVPPGTLSRLSYGKQEWKQHQLLTLAEYFHVDPDDLFGWVDIPDEELNAG